MNHAEHLNSIINWLIENDVVSDYKAAEVNEQFISLPPNVRMIAQRRELLDYFLDEPVCRFGLVLGNVFPNRPQIFLRRLGNPDLTHH